MKIAIGSDHRGFEVKRRIVSLLQRLGHDVIDMGPGSSESVDYPDYAFQVAKAVSERTVDRGILICGTSIGMCILFPPVRACFVPSVYKAVCNKINGFLGGR